MKRTALARRTRLRAVSAKRRAEREERAQIRLMVFARDRWECQASLIPEMARYHQCSGRLTPHHIWKASQGGGYTMENLVTLCDVANDLLESDANFSRLGRQHGLVRRRWSSPTIAPAPDASSPPMRPEPGEASAVRSHPAPCSAGEPPAGARSGTFAGGPDGGPTERSET